ncbi:hypothetical protein B0T16DRAFT_396726, partial [Cercophora newfieldiana]
MSILIKSRRDCLKQQPTMYRLGPSPHRDAISDIGLKHLPGWTSTERLRGGTTMHLSTMVGGPATRSLFSRMSLRTPRNIAQCCGRGRILRIRVGLNGKLFGRQLQRWEDFRVWQLVNRDIYDPDSAYIAFVEKWKRMRVAEGDKGDTEELAALEADPLHLMSLWKDGERERKRDYPHLWWVEKPKLRGEDKGDTKELATRDADHHFRVCAEQVKRRLAQHGFTRTFQLEKDPRRQDKLTTWIEYLLKDGPISFASSSSESGTIGLRRTTCTARAFCCNGF